MEKNNFCDTSSKILVRLDHGVDFLEIYITPKQLELLEYLESEGILDAEIITKKEIEDMRKDFT